jgi:protein TonB
MVLHKVNPVYPALARAARVQGSVVLAAIIGKDGTIQNLHVISSSSPLLIQSALDAVKQWRYRPYILNGEPVEVDTQVTVNFTLSGG